MEKKQVPGLLVLIVAGLLLHDTARVADAQTTLRLGYYSQTCGRAESIVTEEVQKELPYNRRVLASLIRLHFHDCFVNGCDGSVLLESANGQPSEKYAGPNLSLRGLDVIERIKLRLERECPLTVSCADIVAFAARASVNMSGGGWYAVPGGRQDGTVSLASMTGDLPPPNVRNVDDLYSKYFYKKGLTMDEMILLSAAHTLGVAHCSSFDYRLTNDQDKGMDAAFRNSLRSQCAYNPNNVVSLDAGSRDTFDTSYFANVLANKTVLESDAALASPKTAGKVWQWKNNPDWFKGSFAAAMVKMGSIRGTNPGKVRLNCTRVRM